jgi:hypothetical protein
VRLVLYDKGTEEQDGGVQLTHFAIMLDALGAALLCMLHLHNPNYLYTFTTPPFVYLQQPPTDRRGPVNEDLGTTTTFGSFGDVPPMCRQLLQPTGKMSRQQTDGVGKMGNDKVYSTNGATSLTAYTVHK